tara:strand:+ start:1388 stop:1744 length:357 start_codon:yes stop_codon:yes gene_type:complete
MKRAPQIRDFVVCEWRDAFSDAAGVFTDEEIAQVKSVNFKTYGVLARNDMGVASTDAVVVIATEVGDDGNFRGITSIPAEMVVGLELLKAGKRKRSPRIQKALDKLNESTDSLKDIKI